MEELGGSEKVVGISMKSSTPTPSTSCKRGRSLTLGTILRDQPKQTSQPGPSEDDIKERLPKRPRVITTAKEPAAKTRQPTPNNEWGVDMEEAMNVFNMHMGEFDVDESGDTLGQSSTQLNRGQTYVHMIENAIDIKTLIAKKENPQGPEDF